MKRFNIWTFIGIVMMIVATAVLIINYLTWENLNIFDEYTNKMNDIMADDVEIERKWLIDPDNIPFDLSDAEVFKIEQTYISFSPEFRIRRVNDGESYTCAFKANLRDDGLVRDEIETEITEQEYEALVVKGEGNTIHKTRYQFVADDGNFIAIDIFSGDLEGLAYMEIEFANIDDAVAYGNPDWVIADVTDDVHYKNGYLARFGIPENYEELRRHYEG